MKTATTLFKATLLGAGLAVTFLPFVPAMLPAPKPAIVEPADPVKWQPDSVWSPQRVERTCLQCHANKVQGG